MPEPAVLDEKAKPDGLSSGGEARWYTEHTALLIGTAKWALFGAVAGLCVGLGTKVFLIALTWGTRNAHRLDYGRFRSYDLLPLVLPICVWLIRTFAPTAKGHGTEAVITAVHLRNGRIELAVAPVKLLATILTLAFGGSVGKEGPCAQIGAAITSGFADLLKLNEVDRRRLVICGIGAGFSAVFGTPVSGALFGIEVLYLGKIEYGVLFPCLVAGIIAHLVCGVNPPVPHILTTAQAFGRLTVAEMVLMAVVSGVLFGLVALVLIETMRGMERVLHPWSQARPYLVAALGGIALMAVYRIFGDTYAGLGTGVITATMNGAFHLALFAFAIKIVATSITLETGGSGGIVTPLFFIGSSCGAALAVLLKLPVETFAAFGFVSLVAAAANTPIAAAVMGIELLPAPLGVYAALAACTAYLIVGHRSVYSSQVLSISKAAGLIVPTDGTVGALTRANLRVTPGTVTDRVHRRAAAIREKRAKKIMPK